MPSIATKRPPSRGHTEKQEFDTEQYNALDALDGQKNKTYNKEVNQIVTIVTDTDDKKEDGGEERGEKEEALFPYTVFSKNLVFMTVFICGFEGLLSTISGPSFFGCLNEVKKRFGINDETVNMAIVVYFVFQGISPTCVSYLVDANYLGKRNTILIGCIIYGITNIGIANSKSFGTILGLRCIQSFFISPVVAINFSIVGDITTRRNRGNIMSLVSGFQVSAGSAFGAIISAALTSKFGWTGIFYYLAIMGVFSTFLVFFLLPETTRTDVGNGSLIPRRLIDRAPVIYTNFWKRKLLKNSYPKSLEPLKKRGFFSFMEILRKREIIILLLASGMQFCLWNCHLTSISTVLSDSPYNLDTLSIGRCYLPSGFCTLFSIAGAGRVLNWNYKRRKENYDTWIETQRSNEDFDLSLPKYQFNIHRARMEFANFSLLISGISFIICGWLMEKKQSLVPILIFSGIACLFSNCILTFSITLMVDLHPDSRSTAAGVFNLSRCLLSALFIGCLQFMFKSLGVGGTFVLITGITFFFFIIMSYSINHALQWQYDRKQKFEK